MTISAVQISTCQCLSFWKVCRVYGGQWKLSIWAWWSFPATVPCVAQHTKVESFITRPASATWTLFKWLGINSLELLYNVNSPTQRRNVIGTGNGSLSLAWDSWDTDIFDLSIFFNFRFSIGMNRMHDSQKSASLHTCRPIFWRLYMHSLTTVIRNIFSDE